MKSTMEFLLIVLLLFFVETYLFGQSYASLPFTDDFSGSGTSLGSNWSTSYTDAVNGRIERRNMLGNWPLIGIPSTDGATQGSSYASSYGEPSGNGLFIYNNAALASANYLSANLALALNGASEVSAQFQIQDWGSNGTPGGNNYDVLNVYISTDGGGSFGSTSTLVDLSQSPHADGTWNSVSVDISALAAANSLALSANTIVRFTFKLTRRGFLANPRLNSSRAYVYMDNFEVTGTTPLPVELLSFDAVEQNHQSLLSWQTASEINNDYFMVQRSSDGTHFEDLQEVNGQGNNFSIHNYTVYDEHPTEGLNYYRLKQVDYDGTSTYSPMLTLGFYNENDLRLFPNPSTGSFNVAAPILNTGKIIVYDAVGKMVHYEEVSETLKPFHLSLDHLENGNYFIQVSDNTVSNTKTFTILH